MANPIRGEVAFTAGGREMFVQYGTREIAAAQAALGFHRPNPQQPDVAEDVDVPVYADGRPKLDSRQRPVFRRQRVLVDARERQRRMIQAFDACLMNPDPEASVAFLRVGLHPWQRSTGSKHTEEAVQEIVQALGLERIRLLHMQALSLGCYLTGEEAEEEAEGKAETAA